MSLYTEDEVKNKWCPFSRTVLFEAPTPDRQVELLPPAFNRLGHKQAASFTMPISTMCIGSACMAWRWGEGKTRVQTEEPRPDQTTWDRVDGGWRVPTTNDRRGFCGLGDKPTEY